ncbi:MAG: fibronectin type III domain-containing protein [Flavobacterium sp.]|uniref:fibronectin type III domain-containing protein n=1 Tax=Flavobacterium sp. TaxID=239 RepID=UPI0022C62FDF|nr:fibronectin type III domain-containing protein [Flavobacterium sp.]MCZ8196722.1 fibronectin type III domain-containing protein [Flavobacterium sp.]
MKNTQLIRVVILLFSLAIFNSCDVGVEPLDPALVTTDDNNNECPQPTNFVASNFINNSVNLTWNPGNNETSWQIEYGLSGFEMGSGTKVISTNTSMTIANLVSTNSYDFYIKSICGSEVFGDSYGPITVVPVNANCSNPSNLTVVRNPTNAALATVSWTAGGNENAWEIQYGNAGFIIGQGSIVQASSIPKIVDGLTNGSYSFYVRAKCSATEYSNWVGPVNLAAVSTGGTGIVGNYLLTGFTSSVPIDINGNGTSSNNVLSETVCYNDLKLILLANNSFALDSKGTDIVFEVVNGVEIESIECYVDPVETGTWVLNGNILTLTYSDSTTDNYTYNSANNTLKATVSDGTIVGTTDQGGPITLTTDLTFTFTKQ